MVLAPGGNLGGNLPGAAKPPDVYSDDTQSGNLLFVPDNTYNIGASGANRPANIYVGSGQIFVGTGNGPVVGTLYGNVLLGGTAPFLFGGAGIPSAGVGGNGDYYLRNDTPGTALQRIYIKSAGAWVGIV